MLTRSERAAAEARLRQVQRLVNTGTDLDQAAQMLESPVLNELRAREVELNRQRAELSTEFGERHPRMQNLRSEQAALEERKRVEIRQITNRLNDEVQVLRSREATLRGQHRRPQGADGRVPGGRDRARRAAARRHADRSLLETYINRAKEIASQQKAQEPDARIISRAITPEEPTYPRRELIFGVALLGALLIGSLAVFGLERLDQSFRSSEQIEELIGLPTLGLVPAVAGLEKRYGSPQDYVLDNPNSPFGEAVRSLRTAMLLTSMGAPPKTVLLDLVDPGRGQDLDGDVPGAGPCALGAAHADHRLRRAPAAAARADRGRQPGRAQRRAAAAARAQRGGAVRRALGRLFRDRGRAGARSGGAAGLGPHAPAAQGRRGALRPGDPRQPAGAQRVGRARALAAGRQDRVPGALGQHAAHTT